MYNLLFALRFARAGTLAGTFYTLLGVLLWVLLCLCLGILLSLAWRVRSFVARDYLRDLTFIRRIYNNRDRNYYYIVTKKLSNGV
jgi:ascorbate-specific PTS system EIIC-type component UlaA